MKETNNVTEKNLAAVCGLFCGACGLYIGATEDPARLKDIAARRGRTEEELICYGCRSDRRSYYCKSCEIIACAQQKGCEFCGDCPDYPCEKLKAFKEEMPHRAELWQSLERIKQVGWEKWQQEMAKRYTCHNCFTINSSYDVNCRKCGATPSCDYVEAHLEDIHEALRQR